MRRSKSVFVICYFSYVSIYIARVNLSMASGELIEGHILNKAQIGMLGSIFSVVYALGRLANGYISDRKPPWIMISTGLMLTGLSNILISMFPPFEKFLLLWGINAFAQSMLWSAILCIISGCFEEQRAKRMTSYMVTSVATGNIAGIAVNSWVISEYGLTCAFFAPGILTVVCSFLAALIIYGTVPGKKRCSGHRSLLRMNEWKEVGILLIPAMIHGVMKDNISLWIVVFFLDRYCINLNQSAYFILFIPVIGFLGRILYPLLYKVCKEREHRVSALAFVACAVFSLPLCSSAVVPAFSILCLSLVYAAVSLINTSFLSVYPLHFQHNGNVASVSGILDFATYFGAGIGTFLYGHLIENWGYSSMFFSWAVLSLVSLGIFFMKGCLVDRGEHNP